MTVKNRTPSHPQPAPSAGRAHRSRPATPGERSGLRKSKATPAKGSSPRTRQNRIALGAQPRTSLLNRLALHLSRVARLDVAAFLRFRSGELAGFNERRVEAAERAHLLTAIRDRAGAIQGLTVRRQEALALLGRIRGWGAPLRVEYVHLFEV